MCSRKNIFSMVGFGSAAVLFLIIFLSSFLLLRFIKNKESRNHGEDIFLYQYYHRNSVSNQSSFGVVSLPIEIERGSFLSYKSDSHSSLISNFGSLEYECFGSCICERGVRRSSGTILLGTRLKYFLAAISSVVAFAIAKEHFSKDCVEMFSESCELNSIKSEVEDCQPIMRENSDEEAGQEERYNDDWGEESKRRYFCYGNCEDNSRQIKNEGSLRLMEKFNCKKLRREGEVEVNEKGYSVSVTSGTTISTIMRNTAIRKFQKEYLKIYCRANSVFEKTYDNPEKTNAKFGVVYQRTGIYKFSVCIGAPQGGSTKNVKCRQIRPVPKSKNNLYYEKKFWDQKKEWDKTKV